MNKCEADELEEQDNELLQVHAAPLKADSLIHRKSTFTLEERKLSTLRPLHLILMLTLNMIIMPMMVTIILLRNPKFLA